MLKDQSRYNMSQLQEIIDWIFNIFCNNISNIVWLEKGYDKMDKMTFLCHIKSLNICSWENLRDTSEYLVLIHADPAGQMSLVYDPSVDLWNPLIRKPLSQISSSKAEWRPSRAAVCKSAIYFLGQWYIQYS